MCKGGGSSSSTIDPRIMQMLQQNYASAQSVANRPYQPYAGQLTADLTPAQQEAGSLLQSAPAVGQDAINAGIGAAGSGTQYRAPQVQGGFYSPAQSETPVAGLFQTGAPQAGPAAQINAGELPLLSAPNGIGQIPSYMNPFTQDVARATLSDLNLQNQRQLMNNAQAATGEGAFGGDRQGVADALTNEAYQRTAANALANLNSQAFNTAAGLLQNNQQMGLDAGGQNLSAALAAAGQNANALNNMGQFNTGLAQQTGLANLGAANQNSLFNTGNQQQTNLANAGASNTAAQFDLGQALQAALANQGAAAQAQGLNLQGAGLLGTLGTAQQNDYLNGVNALNAFGTEQQQTQQNALNAAYQQYLNQFNYPVQMQQVLNAALSGGMGAGTYNPTAAGQATGGLLGGLGSLGSAAALLLPLL